MLLSLLRFRIADGEHTKDLEKGWAAYRQQNGWIFMQMGGAEAR
jgi:hypothetical protein